MKARARPQLPAQNIIQAALRKTTELLSRELAEPTSHAPGWSDFEWTVARAVAAMHGVSPLLARALRWRGPRDWNDFLQNQRNQTLLRHSRIQELLQLVDDCARTRNIPLVALKGAELHSRGLYAPGDRPMADIDLLVRTEDGACANRVLESLGFHQSGSTSRHRVFVREAYKEPGSLGENADNCLKIELHERIREELPIETADVSEQIFPARPQPGLNPYPSKAALMTHLLLHSAGAMAFRALRLLNLHDIASLCAHMTAQDWDEMLRPQETGEGRWWALPPLHLTARYYRDAVPTRVLSTLEADCPWLLRALVLRRTLCDVSLSRLRIDAFPGIEWAQSTSEMARYVVRRLRPNRDLLESRRHLAQTHPAAASSRWHHLTQGGRLLRWILGRPSRDHALYAVRMALDQARVISQ